MQVESTNLFCPLCKQAFKAEVDPRPNLTRLCDECQSLVRTILPKRNLRPAVATLKQPEYVTASLEQTFVPRSDCARDSFDDRPSSIVDCLPFDKKDAEAPADANGHALSDEESSQGQHQEAFTQPESPAEEHSASLPTSENSNEAVDPWSNPLPTWDYSCNEWPILVKAQPRRRARSLKAPLVIGALIALIVIGYFLVYSPLTDSAGQSQDTATDSDSNRSEGTAPPAMAEAPKQSAPGERQTSSDSAAPSNNGAAQAQTNPAVTQNEFSKSQGSYSLQAASFPDEPSARQYSEKLLRAGISAYVVSADIAGRGKWYRVRVGRFNTPDEAERYRTQSRLRAKAAGMNIDLIMCEYGRP